jgi:hypothetical protein
MANRSSGSYFKNSAFNSVQIKDGKIVRLRKDGTTKAEIGLYNPKHKKVVNDGK